MLEPVDGGEDIARAICSNQWDPATGRVSASLFKGANTSVSRLAVTPLVQTWDLFRARVEKPPEHRLEKVGAINVGDLQLIGKRFTLNPTELTVVPDPLDGYDAHALIPEKISRGLANQILKGLTLHDDPL